MTVSTLRPNGTTSSSGIAVTGAANAHTALNDNTDSSYVTFDAAADTVRLALGDLTLPAGALILRGAVRLRGMIASPAFYFGGITVQWATGSNWIASSTLITWTSPTTWTVDTTTSLGTDAQIDAGDITLTGGGGIGGIDNDEDQGSGGIGGFFFGDPVRLHEAYVDITYVAKPVVTVTTPTEGSTITNANRPLVAWTRTYDTDGGAPTFYEVKIFSAAQYGAGGFNPSTSTPTAESGLVAGSSLSWQDQVGLANATYRAYVRVAQSPAGSAFYSDWDYNQFTINVPTPEPPDVFLTPEPEEGRIRIDIEHVAGAQSTDRLEIQRSTDHLTWLPLRLDTDTAGVIDAADATVFDMEVGNGQTVYYRARALHNDSGSFIVGDWTEDDTVWESNEWWLKSPLHPGLNCPVYVHSFPSIQRPARQGTFQALGATNAIVVSDTRAAWRGTVVMRLDTSSQAAAIDDLLDLGGILLLQGSPDDRNWTDRYVKIGDLDRARLADKEFVEGSLDTLPWVEVDAPSGTIDEWPDYGS